ncbi:MAG: TolC family protein [Bacteroidota bacterium]
MRHPSTTSAPIAALGFGLAMLLSACSFAPHMAQPHAEAELPPDFDLVESDTLRPMAQWWTIYNDPVLNRLIDTTLVRNLDLRAAASRVVEVQHQYRIARAGRRPSIQVTGDISRSDTPANVGFTSELPGLPERFENETYSISGTLAYEMDLWGRLRNQQNAALSEFYATQEDYRAIQMGVVTEAIGTYFEILDVEAQLRLTQANVELLQERIDRTEDRFAQGSVSSFELYSLRQEFENTRTNVPLLEANLSDAEGRLGVLLGMYPSEAAVFLDATRAPDLVLAPIPAGLPSDLLRERPDVAAAVHRLEAARQNIGAAKASLLPSLPMTVTGGIQSPDLGELLNTSQYFTSITRSLTAPLFQGGALRASVRVTEAQYAQLVANYEKTLRTAFNEVQVTLISYDKQRERYAVLQDELAYAEASVEGQEARYRSGVGDYLAYLDARRNLVRVQTTLASAERSVADARLAVHRALGGAWVDDDSAL